MSHKLVANFCARITGKAKIKQSYDGKTELF